MTDTADGVDVAALNYVRATVANLAITPLTMTAEQEAADRLLVCTVSNPPVTFQYACDVSEALGRTFAALDAERAAHRATTAALTDAKTQAMEWRLIAESAEYKPAEARKDTERLDWLEGHWYAFCLRLVPFDPPKILTIRADIDDARAADPETRPR